MTRRAVHASDGAALWLRVWQTLRRSIYSDMHYPSWLRPLLSDDACADGAAAAAACIQSAIISHLPASPTITDRRVHSAKLKRFQAAHKTLSVR